MLTSCYEVSSCLPFSGINKNNIIPMFKYLTESFFSKSNFGEIITLKTDGRTSGMTAWGTGKNYK